MFKKLLLIFVLHLSMLFFGNTAQALSIKIGHNDTSYDGATAALFKVVFERSGYNVSEIKGDSDVLLSMLERGEIDFYLSAWLPGRDAESFAVYQENLTLVTPLYENASSYINETIFEEGSFLNITANAQVNIFGNSTISEGQISCFGGYVNIENVDVSDFNNGCLDALGVQEMINAFKQSRAN